MSWWWRTFLRVVGILQDFVCMVCGTVKPSCTASEAKAAGWIETVRGTLKGWVCAACGADIRKRS